MHRLLANEERHEAHELQQPHQHETAYSDFLVTHPPMFAEATDLLEDDNFLHTTEATFSLLCCSRTQKTMFAAQQLRGYVSA
jgi:hypothetical protein